MVEHLPAVDGMEMHGDGIEGGDDIDDLTDGMKLQQPAQAENQLQLLFRRRTASLEKLGRVSERVQSHGSRMAETRGNFKL